MNKNASNIIIYKANDGLLDVQVKLENESVWLSRNQISELFDKDKSVISRHINNIFKEGELERNSVVAKNATTASDGKTYQVEFFNLDVIISVGYRVNSKKVTKKKKIKGHRFQNPDVWNLEFKKFGIL
ncbi:hypothetical protein F3C99_05645 [Vitellibacter sp. q18]|nr:hypothetical protein [Aequorivita lutea]